MSTDTPRERRVLVIGLDGGSWPVLDRFMRSGHMPTLERLVASGRRATLTSTIPPLTPVAWASFATGTNPGRHGVFGFLSPRDDPGSYSPPPVTSAAVRRPTLWRLVSEAGMKTAVLSVPLTYPPQPVNGRLVTGMFTPGPGARCTHPPSLKDDLIAHDCMPKFQLDFTLRRERGRGDAVLKRSLSGGAESYFSDLEDLTERLLRAARYLIDGPWDLFVTVLIGTDRLQHVLWDEIEAFDSNPDSPLSRRIAHFYSSVDDAISELVAAAGPGANVIVMSDHGFGPCAGRFALGRWLVEAGYAVHRPRRAYRAARGALDALGVKHVARRLVGRGAASRIVRGEFVPLDWSGSRAYFVPGSHGVRVNLRGREKHGVVEPGREFESLRAELRDRILKITDASSGCPVAANAWLAEEIYEGPETVWAPDVTVDPNPDLGYTLATGDLGAGDLVVASPKSRGSHRSDGILLLHGPGVKRAPEGAATHITDVAPTALRLLGLEPPSWMDGRPMTDAFEALPAARPIRVSDDTAEGGVPPESRREAEEDEIRRQLRNLGYVD